MWDSDSKSQLQNFFSAWVRVLQEQPQILEDESPLKENSNTKGKSNEYRYKKTAKATIKK